MNVLLTRAQRGVVVFADLRTFGAEGLDAGRWPAFFADARRRGAVVDDL